MKKVSKYATEGLKFLDFFKQPLLLLVTRKGPEGEREQHDEVGSIYGGFLTLIAFFFLFSNGMGTYKSMVAGKNDIIKN